MFMQLSHYMHMHMYMHMYMYMYVSTLTLTFLEFVLSSFLTSSRQKSVSRLRS